MEAKVDGLKATIHGLLMDNRALVASLVSLQVDFEKAQQELKSLQTRRCVCQERQEKGEREGGKDLDAFKARAKRLEEEKNLARKDTKQLQIEFKEQKKLLKEKEKTEDKRLKEEKKRTQRELKEMVRKEKEEKSRQKEEEKREDKRLKEEEKRIQRELKETVRKEKEEKSRQKEEEKKEQKTKELEKKEMKIEKEREKEKRERRGEEAAE